MSGRGVGPSGDLGGVRRPSRRSRWGRSAHQKVWEGVGRTTRRIGIGRKALAVGQEVSGGPPIGREG